MCVCVRAIALLVQASTSVGEVERLKQALETEVERRKQAQAAGGNGRQNRGEEERNGTCLVQNCYKRH